MATICSEQICTLTDSRPQKETPFSQQAVIGISRTAARSRPAGTSLISRYFRRMSDWMKRRSEQRENRDAFAHLLTLDDSLLDDIGVTRAEVERAARLPLAEDAATLLHEATHGGTDRR